jgi:hypothetical protein
VYTDQKPNRVFFQISSSKTPDIRWIIEANFFVGRDGLNCNASSASAFSIQGDIISEEPELVIPWIYSVGFKYSYARKIQKNINEYVYF